MKPRVAPLLVLALTWGLCTGAVGACNLFRPATPAGGGAGVFVRTNYTDPDSLLATMALGLDAKAQGNGPDAYIGALGTADNGGVFSATFDPAVIINVGLTVAPSWGLDEERRFFGGFVGLRSTAYDMQWSPNPDPSVHDVIEDRHVILYRKYQVYALPTEGDAERIAIGLADLEMVSNGTRWFLVKWTDHVDPSIGVTPPAQEDKSFSARRIDYR
jgi:hypothetical protein